MQIYRNIRIPDSIVFPILLLFTIANNTYATPPPNELFEKANAAYSNEEFEKAMVLYKQCLNIAQSNILHYNIGNTYAKLGKPGNAILHFEKALALDPGMEEAEENANSVRLANSLPDRPENWITILAGQLHVNNWSWLAAISFWSILALVLLPKYFPIQRKLTCYIVLSLISMGFIITMLGLTGYHFRSKEVVAIEKETPLRIAPTKESPNNSTLRAGEIASIEKTRNEYFLVNASNGQAGWAHQSEIGIIWEDVN